MIPVNLDSNTLREAYVPSPAQKPGDPAASTSGARVQPSGGQPGDSVQLSPAALREAALTGRVAANGEAGNLTSSQSQQLYGQIASVESQIVADRQANGGTLSSTDAQAIQQSQSQLSGTVYSDAHNGAAPPADPNVTRAGVRQAVEAGRIVLNEKAGNLSSGQAQQFGSQLSAIHQQIAGGSVGADAINQLQNQLGKQIYEAAHGSSL